MIILQNKRNIKIESFYTMKHEWIGLVLLTWNIVSFNISDWLNQLMQLNNVVFPTADAPINFVNALKLIDKLIFYETSFHYKIITF